MNLSHYIGIRVFGKTLQNFYLSTSTNKIYFFLISNLLWKGKRDKYTHIFASPASAKNSFFGDIFNINKVNNFVDVLSDR